MGTKIKGLFAVIFVLLVVLFAVQKIPFLHGLIYGSETKAAG